MNQQFLFKVLGMRFKDTIVEHNLPELDKSIFSHSDCTKLRAFLYNASQNNESLSRSFIHLLHKGKIEEAELNGDSCIFTIRIDYKREQYHVQLRFDQNKWTFITLYYTGKTTIWKVDNIYKKSTLIIIGLSLFIFFISKMISLSTPIITSYMSKDTTNHSLVGNEEENHEHIEQSGINIDSNIDSNTENNIDPIEDGIAQTDMEEQIEEHKDQIEEEKKDSERDVLEEDQIEEFDQNEGAVQIIISPGMTSLEIAQLLYENEIITNAQELDQHFYSQRVNKRLRRGTYYIQKGTSYQELTHILTNSNY